MIATMAVRFVPSIWHTNRWLCNTEVELETALREYRDAEEEAEGNGIDSDEVEDAPDRRGRIYSQNRAIDQAMRDIRHDHPGEWHLLKGFYIWELWKDNNRGWHETAKMMGWQVPMCEKSLRCRTSADMRLGLAACRNGTDCPRLLAGFWEVHARALRVLLAAIQRRQ